MTTEGDITSQTKSESHRNKGLKFEYLFLTYKDYNTAYYIQLQINVTL